VVSLGPGGGENSPAGVECAEGRDIVAKVVTFGNRSGILIFIGRVWKLGVAVKATDLLPAAYDKAALRGEAEECAPHVLEAMRPEFQALHQPGDLIVGGPEFGVGHAHYFRGAIIACRAAGVSALIADKVSGMFLRSAIDEGFPAWSFSGISAFVDDGDRLEIDFASGVAVNHSRDASQSFPAVNPIILDILTAGSSLQWALARFN
jgi:3-isopropylmalate/(R)-2-methylmalate dehydratase small subunit